MNRFKATITEIITEWGKLDSIHYEVEIEPTKTVYINQNDIKECKTYLEVVIYLQNKYKTKKQFKVLDFEDLNIFQEVR